MTTSDPVLGSVPERYYVHNEDGPDITVHPAGTRLPDTEGLRLLVPRRHTLTALTWPETDR